MSSTKFINFKAGAIFTVSDVNTEVEIKDCEIVVVAVAHKEYKKLTAEDFKSMLSEKGSMFDIKGILPRDELSHKDVDVWRI